ncbi:DUF4387 family protein, partial [Kyrpidia sp.]|uniref:DUF4387 family protein n=1 Tax=Kyrpidia sp. TaxID=2073077 RepID=UPI0025890DD0
MPNCIGVSSRRAPDNRSRPLPRSKTLEPREGGGSRAKLVDLAKTIRSKNAGTDKITFDIIFR